MEGGKQIVTGHSVHSNNKSSLEQKFSFCAEIYHECTIWKEPAKENGKWVSTIEQKKGTISQAHLSRSRQVKNSRLYRELKKYQEAGIQLWLDGEPSTSYQIASCICERTNYMRDYYVDRQNHVCGIGFDRIRKDNQQTVQSPCAKNLNKCEYFLKKSKTVRSQQ